MSIEDGDFSEILTDLALLQHRNYRNPRLLLGIKKRNGAALKPTPCKPTHCEGLIGILSKALDERLARKLTQRQYRDIRIKATNALRRLPLHPAI